MENTVYELKNRSIVKLSNTLNVAKYDLSANTLNILHLFLAQIYVEDKDFKIFKISFTDIEKKLGKRIDRKTVGDICEELLSNPIKIEEYKETKKISYYNWASKAVYYPEAGYLELQIHEDLKKHLLQLKNNFTKFSYNKTKKLRSKYAKRLYMLLMQYMNTQKPFYNISTKDLLYILDLEGTKYSKNFANFKEKVLSVALKQINENTDIDVFMKETKVGKKVERLEFKMNYKEEREEELNKKAQDRYNRTKNYRRSQRRVQEQHRSGVLEAEEWLNKRVSSADSADSIVDADIVPLQKIS